MPIADVEPDPPTNLLRDEALTSKTQVTFTWTAPANDGGDALIGYSIEMDHDNDDVYIEVGSGSTLTSFTMTGMAEGSTYRFRVRAQNDIGYSTYSDVISITAAIVPS